MAGVKKKTIAEMAAEIAGDPSIREEIEREIEMSQIVSLLIKSRLDAGISQKALAASLGWSQSKISRIEAGTDDQVSCFDAISYLAHCHRKVKIFSLPNEATEAHRFDHIREYVLLIQEQLEALRKLADGLHERDSITKGIERFRGEVLFRLLLTSEKRRAGAAGLGKPVSYGMPGNEDMDHRSKRLKPPESVIR